MSLVLLQNVSAIAPGRQTPFEASGGVTPYTYSVLAGGAGGTIASDGRYTAPLSSTGLDTIQVIDGASKKATATIMVSTPLELVCNVLQQGMGLENGQVYLWDQKIFIPTDSRLYVAVSLIAPRCFANNSSPNPITGGLSQVQSANFSAMLDIDILSRGPEARVRKEEVLLALNSQYSEQLQNANGFRIFNVPTSFVNLSEEDGAAIPYRFKITVAVQYFVSSVKAAQYFDTFSTPVISIEP